MARPGDASKRNPASNPEEGSPSAALAAAPPVGLATVAPEMEGLENLGMEDIKVPQLRLLQGQHPDILAKLGTNGDFQDSITKKVLGQEVQFIPLCFAGKMRFKWNTKEEGGWDCMSRDNKRGSKPRVITKTNEKEYGNCDTCRFKEFGTCTHKEKEHLPACTLIPSYFVMVPGQPFFYVLSFPRTKEKIFRDFSTLLRIQASEAGAIPIRHKLFKLGSMVQSGHGNTWLNFVIQGAGVTDKKLQEEADSKYAMIAENFSKFAVDIEEEEPLAAAAPGGKDPAF